MLFGYLLLISLISEVLFALNLKSEEPSPFLIQWINTGENFWFRKNVIFYHDELTNVDNDITLLVLHGYPTSSFDFYKVWPKLRRKFHRIVSLDFLGFGLSDKPPIHHYTIFEQADLVEALLKHLKIKRVYIFAHDYGDTVAQELMARQNEGSLKFLIESICMMNGGIFSDVYRERKTQRVLRTPKVGKIFASLTNYLTFKKSLSSLFGENTQPATFEWHDIWKQVTFKNGQVVLGDLLHYIDERKKFEARWTKAMQTGGVPFLFIYGPSDPVNPWPFPVVFKKTFPLATLHILSQDISHYPQREAPDEVITAYFRWLRITSINNNHISLSYHVNSI